MFQVGRRAPPVVVLPLEHLAGFAEDSKGLEVSIAFDSFKTIQHVDHPHIVPQRMPPGNLLPQRSSPDFEQNAENLVVSIGLHILQTIVSNDHLPNFPGVRAFPR